MNISKEVFPEIPSYGISSETEPKLMAIFLCFIMHYNLA
jgi:hypothetical protein